MKTINTLLLLLHLLLMALINEQLSAQCTNCESTISIQSEVSSAIGSRTVASGFASFASGSDALASGDLSTALGHFSRAVGGHAFSLGTNIESSGSRAMVIGSGFGFDKNNKLLNPFSNSLMVGFNSVFPTLFVSGSRENQKTGKVGIGNVTAPEAKLHIRTDPGEEAKLILEQPVFREAEFILGHEDYGIKSADGQGLVFRSRSNYIFKDGAVGIGTFFPDYDLEVQGSIFSRQLTLFNQDQYDGSIDGWVLRSDANGNASWTNPTSLSDDDWTMSDTNIFRLQGRVGLGTSKPLAQLDLADIYPAGGMNLKIGNDTYLSDVDLSHTLGILGTNDPERGSIMLGTKGPLLNGNDHNLGIGTQEPVTTLEVNRNISDGGNVGISIGNGTSFRWFMGMNNDGKYITDLLIGNHEALSKNPSGFLVIKQDGNVGIGTNDTHSYKLAVNGAILTEEVTVNLSENWPDYVFEEQYDLLSLDRLENYIRNHGHLPDVPDAGEINENGLNLGKMESVLLKKVEELTLYIIDQENRLSAVESKIQKTK